MNSKPEIPKVGRREFLRQANCAAVGSTAVLSTLLNLRMAGGAAGESLPVGDDYKAAVCLFLNGGNDSFNMLTPRGDTEYAEYAERRGDLALAQGDLLPISPATSDGREYGLHPGLPGLQSLFADGDLAFVANVGTLVEPPVVDATLQGAIANGTYPVPLGLYSHSDQIAHWQTSVPDQRSAIGWAGRAADLLEAVNSNPYIGMGISLNGNNILQSGNTAVHYTVGRNGSEPLLSYASGAAEDAVFRNAVNSLLDAEYQNMLRSSFATTTRSAIDASAAFSAAVGSSNPFTSGLFPGDPLGERMEMVARTIAARGALGMRRQTFFVSYAGWDHHDGVIGAQADMLPVVDAAVTAFWEAMGEISLQGDVTLFSVSDFGRTLTSNGQGSDHGWGGHQFVLGGDVNGGDIYGEYPTLEAGSFLDTGRGRIVPTTSVDEYFAEIACWLGVSDGALESVLPNIRRFFIPGSAQPPLGFMDLG